MKVVEYSVLQEQVKDSWNKASHLVLTVLDLVKNINFNRMVCLCFELMWFGFCFSNMYQFFRHRRRAPHRLPKSASAISILPWLFWKKWVFLHGFLPQQRFKCYFSDQGDGTVIVSIGAHDRSMSHDSDATKSGRTRSKRSRSSTKLSY